MKLQTLIKTIHLNMCGNVLIEQPSVGRKLIQDFFQMNGQSVPGKIAFNLFLPDVSLHERDKGNLSEN